MRRRDAAAEGGHDEREPPAGGGPPEALLERDAAALAREEQLAADRVDGELEAGGRAVEDAVGAPGTDPGRRRAGDLGALGGELRVAGRALGSAPSRSAVPFGSVTVWRIAAASVTGATGARPEVLSVSADAAPGRSVEKPAEKPVAGPAPGSACAAAGAAASEASVTARRRRVDRMALHCAARRSPDIVRKVESRRFTLSDDGGAGRCP